MSTRAKYILSTVMIVWLVISWAANGWPKSHFDMAACCFCHIVIGWFLGLAYAHE